MFIWKNDLFNIVNERVLNLLLIQQLCHLRPWLYGLFDYWIF